MCSNAEAAANFYTSIFESSKIGKLSRHGKEGDITNMPHPTPCMMEVKFFLTTSRHGTILLSPPRHSAPAWDSYRPVRFVETRLFTESFVKKLAVL
jgi:hypothetical protein